MSTFDICMGVVYAIGANVAKEFIKPNELLWVLPIYDVYKMCLLPFYGIVLLSVLLDIQTDFIMPIFYGTRYIDYIQTIVLIQKQNYHSWNLHIFHHTTLPSILHISLQDRKFVRFIFFLAGTGATLYALSNNEPKEHRTIYFNMDYLQNLTPVQWTQYIIVIIHTLRSSSHTYRFYLGIYLCAFVILTYQYYTYYN